MKFGRFVAFSLTAALIGTGTLFASGDVTDSTHDCFEKHKAGMTQMIKEVIAVENQKSSAAIQKQSKVQRSRMEFDRPLRWER